MEKLLSKKLTKRKHVQVEQGKKWTLERLHMAWWFSGKSRQNKLV